jgi:hypothetical protein
MKKEATFVTHESLSDEQSVVEGFPVSTKRTLPIAPFPRKYVLSVFVELQDARQAAQTLCSAGFDEQRIHVLQSGDFIEAIAQDKSPLDIFTSMNYNMYLREASQGHSLLAVRPSSYGQLKQIRDLLAPHQAYLAAYIDTWTLTELLA